MRHKNTLSKKGTGLIVVDVQDKFAPAIPGFDGLVANVARLVLTFQMYRLPVVVTEQYPKGLGTTVEKVRVLFPMFEAIEKMELSAADNEAFTNRVRELGIETFVVCGIETHVCINQTVLGLLAQGAAVHVPADAVGSRHRLDHDCALRKMEQAGAIISTTETCMFELVERAGGQDFKNIQRMVKGRLRDPAHAATAGPVPVTPSAAARPEPLQEPVLTESNGDAPVATEELGNALPAPKPPEAAPAKDDAVVDAMLDYIDKKVEALEPIGGADLDLDKDIADLDNLLKVDGIESEPLKLDDDEKPGA
jgi:nicotinamidase-related amidase